MSSSRREPVRNFKFHKVHPLLKNLTFVQDLRTETSVTHVALRNLRAPFRLADLHPGRGGELNSGQFLV